MTSYSYKADMVIKIDGVEIECDALVSFSHHNGLAGDQIDPPEPAGVELESVKVTLPGRDPYELGPPSLIDVLNQKMQDEMFDFVDALEAEAAEARDHD